MENLKSEVKRVESFPAEEPSKLRYGLITGLAAVGVLETAYLTWMKLYGGPVSCPLGGTSCDDVLNSEYGTIFGMRCVNLLCMFGSSVSHSSHFDFNSLDDFTISLSALVAMQEFLCRWSECLHTAL